MREQVLNVPLIMLHKLSTPGVESMVIFKIVLNRSLLLRVLMATRREEKKGNRQKACPGRGGRDPAPDSGCFLHGDTSPLTNILKLAVEHKPMKGRSSPPQNVV